MISPTSAAILFSNGRAILVSTVLFLLACYDSGLQAQEAFKLEPNKTVERTLKGGETHTFQIKLKIGQFMHVEVAQSLGFDLVVSLSAPDGKHLVEMDGKNGYLWREALSCLAEKEGAYRLQIKAYGTTANAGSYAIKIIQVRRPSAADGKRVEAEKAFAEGRRLFDQGGKTVADAAAYFEVALALWRQIGDKYWEGVTLTNLGWTHSVLEHNDQAIEYLSNALQLFREIKEPSGEGKAANGLGLVFNGSRQYEKAISHYNQALVIRREINDRRGKGATLVNLGGVYDSLGQIDKAQKCYEEGLALAKEVSNLEGEAFANARLAFVYYNSQQLDKAKSSLRAGLQIHRELKDQKAIHRTLNQLGLFSLGHTDGAQIYLLEALQISKELKDRPAESETLIYLAMASRSSFQYDKAVAYLEQALAISRELRDRVSESKVLDWLGMLYGSSLGNCNKAREILEQALAIRRDLNDRKGESNVLDHLATAYLCLGNNTKVIEYEEQGLQITKELGDKAGEISFLTGLGSAHSNSGQPERAQAYFKEALVIAKEQKQPHFEGVLLALLANTHDALQQYGQARELYEQALTIARSRNESGSTSRLLQSLAGTYGALRDYAKALEYYEQALALARQSRDRNSEIDILQGLGNFHVYSLQQLDKAEEYLGQALVLAKESDNQYRVAFLLSNLGGLYLKLHQFEKALLYHHQALDAARGSQNSFRENSQLNYLGLTYSSLNQFEKAQEYLNQSLTKAKERKERISEAIAHLLLGNVYFKQNLYEKARDNFEQGLAIAQEIKHIGLKGAATGGVGSIYNDLSQNQRAQTSYEQSLAMMKEIFDRPAEGRILNSLGIAYLNLKQYVKAREFQEQALTIAREVKDKGDEADALINLGTAVFKLNQPEEARGFYEQGLALAREVRNRGNEGYALNGLGDAYQKLGQEKEAEGFYQPALGIAREIRSKQLEGRVLWNLMELTSKQRNLRLAIFYGKQAINAFQVIRNNITSFDKESQHSFLKDKEPAFRALAGILIAQGRLPEAQHVLGLLKEEEYFEFVRRDGNVASSLKQAAELNPEEAAVAKRYSEIADQVAAIGVEYGQLRDNTNRTAEEEQRFAKLKSDLIIANRIFQNFLDEIDKAFAGSPARHEKSFQLRESQALMETLRELGSGAVALYTVAGEDKYRVILITKEVQKAYQYSINGTELNRKVLEFREALQNPQVDPQRLAQELHKILIGPELARDLKQAKAQTLMWSLDGVLRYLPVAALHDGNEYLVVRYRNVIFTPASQSRLKDPVSAKWKGLGLGVSKAQPGFKPLPGVPEELRGIIRDESAAPNPAGLNKVVGSEGVVDGTVLLDEAFTSAAMQTALLKRYPLVHIASHFQFHPGNETDSFLLLGDGAHLSLAQIKSLPNVFSGVDLLTLSACDTATGGAEASGKEVEGFAVLAQRQGAKAVIATLWPVADQGTQLLMREFYRLHETGLSKAEALQHAQIALLKGNPKETGPPRETKQRSSERLSDTTSPAAARPFKVDPNSKYSHPYYWSPFILIGNWK